MKSSETAIRLSERADSFARFWPEISEVYLAQDADLFIVRQVKDACNQAGVRIVEVDSMKQLGEACGVDVKTASAGICR